MSKGAHLRPFLFLRTHQVALGASLTFILVHLFDGLWKPALLQGPLIWFWTYDIAAWVLLPALALLAFHKLATVSFQDYGLGAFLGWKDVVYTLPLPLLISALANVSATAIGRLLFGTPEAAFSYVSVLEPLGRLWLVGAFYLAATAGLWESVFYIGLPWLFVSRVFGKSAATCAAFSVLSAVVFATGHHENGLANMLGAAAFQLVALHWYLKLCTLWPVIGAHTLVDVYYFWPAG